MDVATDTCVLINLAVVGRLDLLKLIPPYIFHSASEVLSEIEDPDQRTVVDQAIAAGHLDEVKLDQPGELGLYVAFQCDPWKRRERLSSARQIARLGHRDGRIERPTVEDGDFRRRLRHHQHAGNSSGRDSGREPHRGRRGRDQNQTGTETIQNEV